MSGGKVVLDPDQYLKLLDTLQKPLDALRTLGAEGFTSGGGPADVDIDGINWMKKGRKPAAPTDNWAWAFAYDRDGKVLPETRELVELLRKSKKVRVGDYEITLGGRDGNLLNRRLVK